ncbi:aldo/keto reductase [Candidatus Puniceispirillum sp.]|nr:aldo/keto reductase [Candidatus Puniceispirillum sp.]
MRYNKLGQTDLLVSELCLGSMTWGTQNTASEGHEQIDMSLDHGINFIDTAEMYPVNPRSKETQGDTERILGQWISQSGRRQDIVIATKIVGKGYMDIREGAPISPATIDLALEASLRSLKTDYIDLYQLHWPNRGSYMFRQNWHYDASNQDSDEVLDHMTKVLHHLEKCRIDGKIRHVGLSNETAWGTMRWLQIAAAQGLPRMVSVQNEYSLLCRHFDLDMSEVTHHEKVGLLSFSPLAAGLLTGKYSGNTTPSGSRRSHVADLGGRISETVWPAIDAYLGIAAKHNLDPSQLAIAWTKSRPFMTSVIFGATTLDQLATAIGAADITLNSNILDDIAATYRRFPMPF